jgi:phospholipid N-methyltransferase
MRGLVRQHLADRLHFFRAFAANPRSVGAVLPTSRWAVRDMLDMADVAAAGLVVELGAGTGVQTRELLARLGPDARLLAFEIDPNLADLLRERYGDPRLEVVCDSAEHLDAHLGTSRADLVVSALPYTSFPADLRRRVLDVVPAVMSKRGTVLVIQYSPVILRELRRRFATVEQRLSPRNVPPAFLFACRDPKV